MYFHGVTMVNREEYGKTEEPLEFLILKMALLLFWVIREGWASTWLSSKESACEGGDADRLRAGAECEAGAEIGAGVEAGAGVKAGTDQTAGEAQ